MEKLKALFANVKAHPIQFLAFGVVFAMFLAAPIFAIVNRLKAKVPGASALPDLKVKA